MADYQNRVSSSFQERMRLIRFRRQRERTHFREELRVVPYWLRVTCGVLYGIALAIAITLNLSRSYLHNHGGRMGSDMWPWVFRDNPLMASLSMAGLITLFAIFITSYLFLLGYVYRDAKRRGMHAGLWLLLILVMSPAYLAIGFLLYFFMREPLPYACPNCAATVGARYNFCPNCKTNLHPACPQCKQPVVETDKFCPNCAYELKGTAGEIAAAG
jgi:Double zinc ribbon